MLASPLKFGCPAYDFFTVNSRYHCQFSPVLVVLSINISMDSCKGPKRLLELESSPSGQQEASQKDSEREDTKRQRKELESTEDDFEEFVALLDKIQYMKSMDKKLGIPDEESVPQDSGVKIHTTKSPCIPSFQWEDFSLSAPQKTMPANTSRRSLSTEENGSRSEEKGKQTVQPANYLKMGSSSDAYDKSPTESFDLNVEAS